MYYVYLIALCCLILAVILGGLSALYVWVIPERDEDETLHMPGKDGIHYGESGKFTALTLVIIAGISLITSGVSGIVGAVNVANARADYYTYREIYNMYYTMYDDSQDLANIGYTEQVISYNMWLVNARANQNAYGRFSKWYGYDLYSLEYITMRGEE